MPLKIATFNLNNLFDRAKILDISSPNSNGFSGESKAVLQDVSDLNELLEKESYAGATGTKIKKLLKKYFVDQPFKSKNYFSINHIREKLYTISNGQVSLKAEGKNDWLGYVEFTKVRTNDVAVINTARVLQAVDADIVCTIEVDNRLALSNFNELMKRELQMRYDHFMLIDGNDERGIDVGIFSKHIIKNICSHVDDFYTATNGKNYPIFSRDCPEYEITLPANRNIHFLCNHFKSKGYGSQASSNEKRKKQADRVVEILKRFNLSQDLVVVCGDFNDTPDSAPLASLMQQNGLQDVLNSPHFTGSRATYHTGNQQIDYLMVSKPLFNAISDVGIERRGIFKNGNPSFPEVTSKVTQASDHACVWATFNL